MTPEWLIAEGPMPGRPSLLHKAVRVKLFEGERHYKDYEGNVMHTVPTVSYVDGYVKHEDPSGVIFENGTVLTYPFSYRLLTEG